MFALNIVGSSIAAASIPGAGATDLPKKLERKGH